jgi:CO/xanthine dehydrogenase FAD-binding subunit
MFTMMSMFQPATLEEAYEVLMKSKNNTVLGGCGYLRMGSKRISTGIELTKLNLNYISEENGFIEIGAYATLRDLETSPLLNKYFNGVIEKAVADLIGVQFRSMVTAGATVFSKYGFSDPLTALLSLDCEVELFKGGRMPLEDFLNRPFEKDILVRIFLKANGRKAVYRNFRNAASDYSILNVSVSRLEDDFRIAVGARPATARIAKKASAFISGKGLQNATDEALIAEAAKLAREELNFGTNMRGTKEYRENLCRVLVERAIKEVRECR